MNINRPLFALFCLVLCFGCHRKPEDLEPKINYVIQDSYLKARPQPFAPLTPEEQETSWGREYQIGLGFSQQLDLYQAITAFKRALILIPAHLSERRLELNYAILLNYYLGKKYSDVIYTFETSALHQVDKSFVACKDLLVILYDSYQQTGQTEQAEGMLALLRGYYPEEAKKLELSAALLKANFPELNTYAKEYPDVRELLDTYHREKKSVATAKSLNLLPGAGYFYLGQPQTGTTALLVNGLFIAATYHFFSRGNIAAGIIFAGFELGWYIGGIHGAGEEAKFYNEQIYSKYATPLMNQKGYFPVFSLNYAF